LAALGLSFTVHVSNVAEDVLDGEPPEALVRRLSLDKARASACDLAAHGDVIVIAADTIVVAPHGEDILGKPSHADEARAMLRRLRGQRHTVYTGLALVDASGMEQVLAVCTPVVMRAYSDAEIEAYIASGDPMDKAGAYAIQHPSFAPIDHLEQCYANVMGLPLCHLYRALLTRGVRAPQHPLQVCPYPLEAGACPWCEDILR
jgi:MAF protein